MERPRFQLFEDLPTPDPSVTPQVRRLVEVLVKLNNDLAGLSADTLLERLGDAERPAILEDGKVRDNLRLAAMTITEAAQVARRLDSQAADRLEHMASQVLVSLSPSQVIHEAMSCLAGVMKATMIDGPARGATAVHVSSVAYAVAEAEASLHAEIDLRLDEIREGIETNELPADLVTQLEELREAIHKGERPHTLLGRFARLAEQLGSVADLVERLARLAGIVLGNA